LERRHLFVDCLGLGGIGSKEDEKLDGTAKDIEKRGRLRRFRAGCGDERIVQRLFLSSPSEISLNLDQ
jgi:hypothetical protein